MSQVQSSRIGVRYPNLPTMYDLPSESPEEYGLPDRFHELQPDLLSWTCQPPDYPRQNYLMAQDLNLYYDIEHPNWYKRPDWFVVLGVESENCQEDLRLSYVTWQEERNPFLVVELLSPGTRTEDLGQTRASVDLPPTKWEVYEQILEIPYYVVYDRYENDFRGFRLQGNRYRSLDVSTGRLWLEELGLGLGLWEGSYHEVRGLWLRFYDRQNNWIATPSELAQQERQRADRAELTLQQERDRADRAELELEQLRDRLRALNIDPDVNNDD